MYSAKRQYFGGQKPLLDTVISPVLVTVAESVMLSF